ncbi:MAG: efflux RND transporter periplasmic adaptor subunit [Bdellovibrionota bacterium]
MANKFKATSITLSILSLVIVGWVGCSRQHTVEAKRGPIIEAVYGLGTVVAAKVFRVKVGVTLTIRKIFVREGDRVKAGTVLVSFGEANVQRAPFDGTVTAILFKEGENVFPQAPVLSLMNLEDLYVEVSLEQQGALRVRPGLKAVLSFESLRGQKFEGKVRSVFPNEGQFLVHIDIQKFPPGILPGMTADVAIEVERKSDALLVPVAAVVGGRIFINRNGKKEKVAVQLGTVDGEQAEVIGGDLSPGDQIFLQRK